MLGALALLVSLAAAEPQADRIPVLLKHPHPTVEVEQAEVDCGDNPIVWKIVDDLKYDWNADGKPDVFKLEEAGNPECGNLGEPARLTIGLSGQKSFRLDIAGVSFDRVPPGGAQHLLASQRLFLVRLSTRTEEPPVLLLTPDAMHETSEMMFGLVDGKVEEVDPPGPLIISEIRDVDGDRTSELIGVPSESDQRSGDLCREYNPTLVYRHRNGKKPAFVLDEDLSRTANLQRGFPWAGAKYISQDEAMVIMDPDTKKRRVMGRAEAEKLGVKDCFRDP